MKHISVIVSDDLYQRIINYADSNELSLSELVCESLKQKLNGSYTGKTKLNNDEVYLLKEQLKEANESRQRADAIILQMAHQNQFILEDMRNRNWWTRIKMALGFAHS